MSQGVIELKSTMSETPAEDLHKDIARRDYLTFRLGEEEYGIDILLVQEIRSYEQPTKMANTSDFIKGVVNLRGVIVPIIDMRMKFNLPRVEYTNLTVVIILNIGHTNIGMVVDGVADVISLTPAEIRPVPQFESSIGSEHILAIASFEERMLILLDIEGLLSNSGMGLVVDRNK
jgi:purine-binding chemotaxis protein CheW